MALALVVGFLLGYLGSIPAAGPLAVVLVAAALAGQSRRFLLLAIGGASAEGLWALAAARGLGWVLEAHPALDRALRTGGAALVVAMGLALALAPRRAAEAPSAGRATSALLTGFVLVALNPSFLGSWIASCAVLRAYPVLAPAVAPTHAIGLAAGAVVGVVSWFATLGRLLARYRERLGAWHGQLVRGLGWVLVALGIAGLLQRLA
ncbi:LysE family transporter [Sorangium sp. So ce260]|uniref:LysE family transporter n=1 Tax=Sorangium sp. So ce260 TaxID=3133291 RepID=UPI003F615877